MSAPDMIKAEESCRTEAYMDDRDVPTIGWGCTGPDIVLGLVWTQEQCDAELATRFATLEAQLSHIVKAPLSSEQYDALTSLVWNIGIGQFTAGPFGCTILRRLNALDYSGAAAAWTDAAHIFNKEHKKGVLVESDALTNRRRREAALFIDGTTQTPTPSPYPLETT
jgi:lysozyme